jgi:hypothetical protein
MKRVARIALGLGVLAAAGIASHEGLKLAAEGQGALAAFAVSTCSACHR